MSEPVGIAQAYRRCEAITLAEAANFFYGIRLLPRERRQAMSAAYAFARRVDDIGDGSLAPEEKLTLLDEQARALEVIEAGGPAGVDPTDPVMVALADAEERFELPLPALGELVEGVRMDVLGITYESFDELVSYCRRVAGTIGRVCLAIFGLRERGALDAERARSLADDLGVALQLTNILRDIREDAGNGRVYLPREDLRRFGLIGDGEEGGPQQALAVLGAVSLESGAQPRELERLSQLVRFEAERASEWFDRGLALAHLLDRRSAACVLAMAGIYRRLLERIELDPARALSTRMSIPAREKAWVAARGMLGAGR
jgi:phytoene synthase